MEGTKPAIVRFGVFEANLRGSELCKNGFRIKLQELPFKILALLLERPGELVTREELRQKLWPEGTFVDFEHGLNTAIMKLRAALDDSADKPRFIETVARHGYRFIAPVTASSSETPVAAAAGDFTVPGEEAGAEIAAPLGATARFRPLLFAALGLASLLLVLVGLNVGGFRDRLFPKPTPAAFRAIAVLPLENLSGDPAQEYFSDGMTDALITDLAKISSLRVMSRTSVMRYKSTTKTTAQIARELRVDAFVEGSVVRSGDKVRITAQLIDAASDQHLWAESYERGQGDIIALQGEVAQAIARQIRGKLTPHEQTRMATARAVNPKAYDANLLGWYHWHKSVPSDWEKAIAYFNQAIEIDPAYAAAHSGLAYGYLRLGDRGTLPARQAMPRAKAAALKAQELDPSLAEAHFALAFVAMYYDWDWNLAEQEFPRGFELNPGYSLGRQWYADYLMFRGRYEEAFAEQHRALEADPLSLVHQMRLGQLLYYARRYDQAIGQAGKILEMDPNSHFAHYMLADVYRHNGMYQEAVAQYCKIWTLEGDKERAAGYQRAFEASGFKGAQRWYRDYLLRAGGKPPGPAFMLANVHAGLGENDAAFQLLEKFYQERRPYLLYLKLDPDFDPLRPDPRFADLARRLGLPP